MLVGVGAFFIYQGCQLLVIADQVFKQKYITGMAALMRAEADRRDLSVAASVIILVGIFVIILTLAWKPRIDDGVRLGDYR